MTTTTTRNGVVGPANSTTASGPWSLRFVAIESVTVRAGTYRACRIEIEAPLSRGTTSSVGWFLPGIGLEVKADYFADGVLTSRVELIHATRNGKRI